MYRYKDEFCGFDLRPRKAKLTKAFGLIAPESSDDIPVIANTPCYFKFGGEHVPDDYFTEPASMLRYQQNGFASHLAAVDDDTVPYFMPWFGTAVLASGFGAKIIYHENSDPSAATPVFESAGDIARPKRPNPYSDGLMPRVIRFIEYAFAHGELEVGVTDLNSPLCTAAQLRGYEKLFYWMYDEPDAVDELMSLITESFIGWVKLQWELTGQPFGYSCGLQGVFSPKGGVWLSDDDLVSLSPPLYSRPPFEAANETVKAIRSIKINRK